jgi:hypothetical protein
MQQHPINNSFSKIFKISAIQTSDQFKIPKNKKKSKSQIWLYCTFHGTEKGEDIMGCN